MSVYKKLQEARVKFHGKSLKKSGENKFAGYKYFELGDFLPTVQEIFGEVGLAGVVDFSKDVATLTIVDVTNPVDFIVFGSPIAEVNLKGCLPIQGIGAAQTYLRRYLWVAAMEIVENDAIDATTGNAEPEKKAHKPAKGTITPTTGAVEALDEASQGRAENISKRMMELWKQGEKDQAYDLYFNNGLDTDMKAGVWALLKPSHKPGLPLTHPV